MTLIGKINSNYVGISNRITEAYTESHGLFCDIYFPVHAKNPSTNNTYNDVDIFEPHQNTEYSDDPSVCQTKFYIPFLLKKESMNSSEAEFDSFYLAEENQRPFLETSKARELPIGTKVVVYLEYSKMYFWVDKILVVNGANGHMILRQYLAPLAER